MTDLQLYLAIGVPIAFNALGFALLSTLLSARINDVQSRVTELRMDMGSRFEHLEKLFDAKRSLVEGVLDARLKSQEER
jgi:hypothetical protein